MGRAAAGVVDEGGAGLRRTAAEAAGGRGHRVGAVGLPPDADRRRAGPPAVRAAARARPGGAGGRRPGAGVVPRRRRRWTCGGAGPWRTWRSGSRGGWRPRGSRACGWTPRSCGWRPRSRAGHAPAVLEQARALVAQAPFRERRWALLATRAAPGGPAGGGPRRGEAGPRDAGRRARPGPRPGAGGARAAAAAAGPVADPAGGPRGQRRLPLPRAAALRRRGRRLVLRPGGRRRGVPAAAAGLRSPGRGRARPGSASPRSSAPGWSRRWSAAGRRSW